jgi:hypothetical protein
VRWHTETYEEQEHRLRNWHRWWAWRPVTVYNSDKGYHQSIWLETVWRQGEQVSGFEYDSFWKWRYLIDPCDFELLKMKNPEEEQ